MSASLLQGAAPPRAVPAGVANKHAMDCVPDTSEGSRGGNGLCAHFHRPGLVGHTQNQPG